MSATTTDGSNGLQSCSTERGSSGNDSVVAAVQAAPEIPRNGSQLAPNGFAGGDKWGKEPAVKKCGSITIPTLTKTVTLLMALASVGRVWLLHYGHSTGKLCSPRDKNACVTSVEALVLVSIARFTAGALFPSIAFCILSKCYATRYFLHNSWLSLIVDLEPTHNLHTYFGCVTLICSVIHGLAHIARYLYEQDPNVMLNHGVNRSGLAALVLMILSVVPMAMRFCIARWKFEVRKSMHMLFVPMLIAICFHTPSLKYMGAFFLVWYLVDRLYYTTRQTFFISRPKYKAIGRGTLVRFDLPSGYKFKAGAYIQVNCPAISSLEWHPFSLFPVPGPGARAGFHVEAVGDWTQELFRLGMENPRMSLWISAAQPSVLENAIYYENVILICTGAGITSAVSLAHRFAKNKNVHLMWMSRDAGMVAMFEKQLRSVKSTIHLTGRQSDKTKERMMTLLAPPKDQVITQVRSRRPSLILSSVGSPAPSSQNLAALNLAAQQQQVSGVDGQGSGSDDQQRMSTVDLSLDIPALECSEGLVFEEEGDENMNGRRREGGKARGLGGNIAWGRDDSLKLPATRPSRRVCRKIFPHRGQHPVSIKFGRPDIKGFITGILQGTAETTEWTVQQTGRLPMRRQGRDRLDSKQRDSKSDLMMADLSVVEEGMEKKASGIFTEGSANITAEVSPGGTVMHNASAASWVVLYCGANARVERALVSACEEHGVAWRKEYFSAW